MRFETQGGFFSRDSAIMRLVEGLRKASEDAYAIGHHDKMQDDIHLGDQWLKIGQNLEQMAKLVLTLGTRRRQ